MSLSKDVIIKILLQRIEDQKNSRHIKSIPGRKCDLCCKFFSMKHEWRTRNNMSIRNPAWVCKTCACDIDIPRYCILFPLGNVRCETCREVLPFNSQVYRFNEEDDNFLCDKCFATLDEAYYEKDDYKIVKRTYKCIENNTNDDKL